MREQEIKLFKRVRGNIYAVGIAPHKSIVQITLKRQTICVAINLALLSVG